MPTPGSPTTVTSCTVRSAATLSKVPRSSVRSSSRPTSGVVIERITSLPKRARGATARHTGTGSAFPFALDRLQRLVLEHALGRLIRALPDRDAVHRRLRLDPGGGVDDVAGDHPLARSGRASSSTTASPVFTPTRTDSASGASAVVQLLDRLQDRNPARTARSASSSCATGAPNTAMTASPMNFSTVPPNASILPRPRVVGGDPRLHLLRIGALRRGREADRSQNSTDTTFRSFSCCPGRRRERGGAEAAELEPVRGLLAAGGTGRHRATLRSQTEAAGSTKAVAAVAETFNRAIGPARVLVQAVLDGVPGRGSPASPLSAAA